MNLEELIKQEEKVVRKVFELKNKLIEAEFREKNQECKLWVETPFAQKGLKNAEQRKAFVKAELAKQIRTSDLYKNQINLCENVLKLIRFKSRAIVDGGYDEKEDYDYYDEMIENLIKKIE